MITFVGRSKFQKGLDDKSLQSVISKKHWHREITLACLGDRKTKLQPDQNQNYIFKESFPVKSTSRPIWTILTTIVFKLVPLLNLLRFQTADSHM